MTTAAKIAFGAELWVAASGGTLAKVAELLSVTPPRLKRDLQDATSHDSPGGAMQMIADGVYDPGEIAFQTNYIAGSAGDLALVGFATSGELIDWKIVVKSAADTVDLTGSGYLTEYGVDALPVKGKQAASGSIKVSGEVTQAASA